MRDIDITAWGHSAVRLEKSGQRLVIDPGQFSAPAVLDQATAVLITHEHTDHVVPDRLGPALAARPDLEVWVPTAVAAQLADAGAPDERIHPLDASTAFETAGFRVQACVTDHALVHPTLPATANVTYLVDGAVLHPGDSFTPPPAGASVQVLLLPISAPWMKLAEAIDYVRRVEPATAVPIHDAVLSDDGKMITDRVLGTMTGSARYCRLAAGETLTTRSAS